MTILHKIHRSKTIDFYSVSTVTKLDLPLIENGISAGFPSPADDFMDVSIDLNRDLIKNPASTFLGKVSGDSMQDLGINDGDLIVIDKSLEPSNGKIAVCFIDGEFTLKTIRIENDKLWLVPANAKYKPIEVTEDNHFVVWGILVHVIKSF
ncbi:MAG: translesion error-prone DNA polymerase V autoproteolytic subunit [Bacteroidales bacterium]|nr:translesion error-prone DNA polymerase V autoproteolytic subunit [Bacteroidales bacterium]